MNILGSQYTIQNRAFEIYVSGCKGNPHCKGCHNPESWDFNAGDKMNRELLKKYQKKIKEFDKLIDNIMIFGGEPLDQSNEDLEELLTFMSSTNKDIWLFTRYSLDKVPDFVKGLCKYIKCGEYIPDLTVDNNVQYGIKLATSNQKIHKKGLDY